MAYDSREHFYCHNKMMSSCTCLHHALVYIMCLHSIPQVECLEWILDHGGSIHDRDNLGGTPVHDAAEQGQVNVAVY